MQWGRGGWNPQKKNFEGADLWGKNMNCFFSWAGTGVGGWIYIERLTGGGFLWKNKKDR